MRCPLELIDDNYICPVCEWKKPAKYFSSTPSRRCRSYTSQAVDGQISFDATRTDAEVLYIITNYCMWCPAWNTNPNAKKKCKHCGCGSTETIENLHRRRIRNCPKRCDHPAKWTEATIQNNLHPNPKKPT